MPFKDANKRRASQNRWLKENTKGFYIRLSKKTDADIIDYLSSVENKQGFVKGLIRMEILRDNSVD